MKHSIFILAILFCACQKDPTSNPQPQKPVQKTTDTVYSYNWTWYNDSNTLNHTLSGNYSYQVNPQEYVGTDIVKDIISTWIRPAYSTGPWTKLPCKGFYTPTDSVAFDPFHGIRYREGSVKVAPQNIDVKAFADISN